MSRFAVTRHGWRDNRPLNNYLLNRQWLNSKQWPKSKQWLNSNSKRHPKKEV